MAAPLCPVCEKRAAEPGFKPFCSKHCADIDLGRWLGGQYVVEGQDSPPETGGQAPDPED